MRRDCHPRTGGSTRPPPSSHGRTRELHIDTKIIPMVAKVPSRNWILLFEWDLPDSSRIGLEECERKGRFAAMNKIVWCSEVSNSARSVQHGALFAESDLVKDLQLVAIGVAGEFFLNGILHGQTPWFAIADYSWSIREIHIRVIQSQNNLRE